MADIVICGAGMAGVATAHYLAVKHGIADVLLVDKRAPLTLTSDKSVEGYRNWWPDRLMVDFMNRSIDLMEVIALGSDNAIQLNRRGYAYVTSEALAASQFQSNARRYADELGLGPLRVHGGAGGPSEGGYQPPVLEGWQIQPQGVDLLLESEIIEQHFSYLTPETQAVLHARRAGWLSGQQLGMNLLEEARRRGVRELRGEVLGVEQDGQGVSAVKVAAEGGRLETVETRRFVNAAGPFAASVGKLLGLELPLETILHQKLVMRDHLGVVARDAPLTILVDSQHLDWSDEEREMWGSEPGYEWLLDEFPGGIHIRPEGGTDSEWLMFGWGFHNHASLPEWEPEFSPEFPEIALRGALKLVPGLAAYVGRMPQPLMHDGGYYTRTRENLPLIGPLGVKGAFVVGGLSGYGVMAACAAGELGADWVVGAELPQYAERLVLARYDDADYVASLDEQGARGEL